MSDLVGNRHDRFSHDATHFIWRFSESGFQISFCFVHSKCKPRQWKMMFSSRKLVWFPTCTLLTPLDHFCQNVCLLNLPYITVQSVSSILFLFNPLVLSDDTLLKVPVSRNLKYVCCPLSVIQSVRLVCKCSI